jgi:hypothetical protein
MSKIPSFSGLYPNTSPVKERIRKAIKSRKTMNLNTLNKLTKSIARQTLMKMTEVTHDMNQFELLLHSTTIDIDWDQVSKEVKLSSEVCEWEWRNKRFPLLNFKEFTRQELEKLRNLLLKNNYNFIKSTHELLVNRTPYFVYKTFLKKIKKINLIGKWTSEEDSILKKAVSEIGQDWKTVAYYLQNRSPAQCLQRWNFSLNPQIKKGRWSKKEDEQLLKGVQEFGKKWNKIRVDGRTDAQIRERFENVLNPHLNKGPWTMEEGKRLKDLVDKIGPKWSIISLEFPNRTDNMCKREWTTLTRAERDSSSEARVNIK